MNKKIVIVGASSGIGARIARDFAAAGMSVAIAARNEERLKEIAAEYPDNIIYETIDITKPDAHSRLLQLIKRNGGMDTLLMASGVGFQNPSMNLGKELNMLETNVVGWARIIATAYRYYRDTPGATPGQIAAITSVASTQGIGVAAAYSASKRFQRTYLTALEQLAHRQKVDIKITEIRPGFIRTPLLDPALDYPMIMSVDYAVPMIELAILRGQRVATVDWRWRLLCAAWRCIPRSWWVKMPVGFDNR